MLAPRREDRRRPGGGGVDKALPSLTRPRRHPVLPRDPDWVAHPLLDRALAKGRGVAALGGEEEGAAGGQARGCLCLIPSVWL